MWLSLPLRTSFNNFTGSLCNTWRQGEWRSKYQSGPEKIHLRRPTAAPTPCTCHNCDQKIEKDLNNTSKHSFNIDESFLKGHENRYNNESMVYYSEKDNKYVFEENKFDNVYNTNINNNYGNRLIKENDTMNDFDSQNAFTNIDKTFYKDIRKILPKDDMFITEKFYNNSLLNQVEIIENYETQAQFVSDLFKNCDNCCDPDDERCNENSNKNNNEQNINVKNYHENCTCTDKQCEIGCGCICDDCYSPCWPKDWIKVDYPDARVISVNYTSDPHLWRPLWIKENKRLCLHERAEQMTEQLLDLDVGQRPVIWVGHSKGGLFIKQIYCEAYEAYLKSHSDKIEQTHNSSFENRVEDVNNRIHSIVTEHTNKVNENKSSNELNTYEYIKCNFKNDQNSNYRYANLDSNMNDIMDENTNPTSLKIEKKILKRRNGDQISSSHIEEDMLERRASLWYNSGAFMFYSVPHRGSPLADIKTPITARSIELIEISKDNSLVLSLQERWLRATALSMPLVRSLVETRRTLMSVLWLRIVSTDSADPGIGALCGVSVDHREICKPSSRRCLLYTELSALIKVALNKLKL